MKIRKGDTVKIMAGADRGKTGKVLRAFPEDNKILVEGINMKKKHMKPRQEGKSGQMVDKFHPISVSNAMLLDPKSGEPTRVGKKKVGEKMVRVSKKTDSVFDK